MPTDILDDHPALAYTLLALATIVALGGAVVSFVSPGKFPPGDYFRDVTIIAAALGLGTGISRFLRQVSGAGSSSAGVTLSASARTSGEPGSQEQLANDEGVY